MGPRPVAEGGTDRPAVVAGTAVLVLVLATMGGLVALAASRPVAPSPAASAAPGPSPSAGHFLYASTRTAPAIDLIDPDDRPFSLGSLRGSEVLVFFGYTHCPDVCPATTGIVGKVLAATSPSTRAVFVTVDPERDTPEWLKQYSAFLPAGFTAVTGSAGQIRATADAWGVRYARIEGASPDAYTMAHTADVFLVDASGELRAHFPFGTQAGPMTEVVREVGASTPSVAPSGPAASPSASPTPAAASELAVRVASSSVWALGSSPVILSLATDAGPLADDQARPVVQLIGADGSSVGSATTAVAVRPAGLATVSYVASLDVPAPGAWDIAVTLSTGGRTLRGSAAIDALDPGTSAALGSAAPTIHTPTLVDAGGVQRAVTTDPIPDPRLYQRSTTDALASHMPFVLIVDSVQFRVSPVCGKAVSIARYLADRWPDVAFIHAEPFVYTLVSDWPVLSGDLADPPLDPVALAWGIGGAPWGSLSVPWAFVVDGDGIVRAKYQGLMGTSDIDVILALLAGDN